MAQEAGELVWVHYDPETAALVIEDAGFHVFGLCNNVAPFADLICQNDPVMRGWPMDHGLLLISYPAGDVAIPSHEVNRSIATVIPPPQLNIWHGPVIIVAIRPNPDGQFCLVDNLRWRDITAAVTYFRARPDFTAWPLPPEWPAAQPVLQLKYPNNKFVAPCFGAPPPIATVNAWVAHPQTWRRCMAAYRLDLDWSICWANGPSWRDADLTENEDARWLKSADGTEILPQHLEMFNLYLDDAFSTDLLPNRNGFSRYCANYCTARGIPLPIIDLTPDASLSGATVARGDVVALDNEIFWRKVFDLEQSRGNRPSVTLPRHLDLQHSLLVAARVFRSLQYGFRTEVWDTYWFGDRVSQPGITEILRDGPAEHAISVDIPRGRLGIHLNPVGGMHFSVMPC